VRARESPPKPAPTTAMDKILLRGMVDEQPPPVRLSPSPWCGGAMSDDEEKIVLEFAWRAGSPSLRIRHVDERSGLNSK
jgi:hypothetical protein